MSESDNRKECEEGGKLPRFDGITLDELQLSHMEWAFRSILNFGREQSVEKAMEPLVGALEELGELAHSILKLKQGIRRDEDHHAAGQDAVGDVIIYLTDVCTRMGWSLQRCVDDAWTEVAQRDWNKHRAEHDDNHAE